MDRKPALTKRIPIAIIGLGAAGHSLALRLCEAGFRRLVLVGRSRAAERKLAREVHAEFVTNSVHLQRFQGIIILAVGDSRIRDAVRELARLPLDWPGITVFHTSGVQDASILRSLAGQGAGVAAWHPYQTFPKASREAARLEGVTFGIDGNPRGVRVAFRLARALGGKPVRIPAEMRVLYHASAVFASGFVAANLAAAVEILKKVGLSEKRAREAAFAIAHETLDNAERLGPRKAMTGPAVRGDGKTIRKHFLALEKAMPELARMYEIIGKRYSVRSRNR
ncbi:DUF2520 domain-containing protein [bacterium]|nr:DUF2520 domain-containing protein [bacterium]MBU1983046.1 DUF2520 domain-containing protein [bacterium]